MPIYPDKKDGVITGRWRVEVQLGSMRKRGRFETMAEAKRAEHEWRAQLARGETEDAARRTDAQPQLLSQLLAKAAPVLWQPGSEHGQLCERKIRWIIKQCGDPRLSSLPVDFVDNVVLKLRKAGKAPGTINRYLSPLHNLLAWAAKPTRRYLPILPEFPWQEEKEGRVRWLTPDEEYRLIATLRALKGRRAGPGRPADVDWDEVADLCIVAIDTGCRRSELLSARPEQLDGKWLRLWKTKDDEPRSVPLSARAQEILARRLPFKVKEYSLRWAWDRAKIAMGLSDDPDFVFHCLRHTRATRLVEMGVNLRVIQRFMGHKSIETTLRYAHVSDDMLAQAGENIDRWNSLHLRELVGDQKWGINTPPRPPSEAPLHRSVLEVVE